VTEAAVSDMTEIAAAKIALEKGDADEKQFADQMVKDHTQTSTELKALVSGGGVQATLPTALDSASQKQIDKLNAATPADFRSDYDSSQVSAHKSAVSPFDRYAKGGDNAKLKDWAQKRFHIFSIISTWLMRWTSGRSRKGLGELSSKGAPLRGPKHFLIAVNLLGEMPWPW
jgi:predicted outer membrane protein